MIGSELETIIKFNAPSAEGEATVQLWTCEATMHIQMLKWKIEPREASERHHIYCAWYTIPRSWVRIGPVRVHRKRVRSMSEHPTNGGVADPDAE